MNIVYNDAKKDLPSDQLRRLFISAGWSDGSETPDKELQRKLNTEDWEI